MQCRKYYVNANWNSAQILTQRFLFPRLFSFARRAISFAPDIARSVVARSLAKLNLLIIQILLSFVQNCRAASV